MAEQRGVTTQQIFEMLMQSQFWPREQMRAFQRSQLEQLLRHAKANVPFYRNRLDCIFRKDGSIDWERWEDIPVVTREDLRDRRDDMQARVLPLGHGPTTSFFTSGSSGIPIEFTTTHLSNSARQAAFMRLYRTFSFPEGLRMAHASTGTPEGKPLKRVPIWSGGNEAIGQPPVLYIPRTLSATEQLEVLRREKIAFFYEFATGLLTLARANIEAGCPVRMPFTMSFGMGLQDSESELIEESFDCQLISIYSSKECGLIAHSCPGERHFDQCEELVFVEGPSPQQAEGKLEAIVTPLFNAAQPLIRYAHGDTITVGGSCSRSSLPVILRIDGRSDPVFVLNGMPWAAVAIKDDLIVGNLRALAIQIAQTGTNTIEIRYVAKSTPSRQAVQEVRRHIKDCTGMNVDVRFKAVRIIPMNAGGKQNRYVREYESERHSHGV